MDKNSEKFTIGAFGIIFDESGRVLLCHRTDSDIWNLPGGGVELGETPVEAVIREINEETGLTAVPIHLNAIYSKLQTKGMVFCFKCKVTGGIMKLSNESDQIEYFDINRLPGNIKFGHSQRIYDAIEDRAALLYKKE